MFLNFFACGKFGSHGRFAIYWISRNNGLGCIGSLLYFVLVFFSPFSIAITLLGEERANLNAFRMFVLVSGKGCGL